MSLHSWHNGYWWECWVSYRGLSVGRGSRWRVLGYAKCLWAQACYHSGIPGAWRLA